MTRRSFWIASLAFFAVSGALIGRVLYVLLLQPAVSGIVFVMVIGIGLLKIHSLDKHWSGRKAGDPNGPRRKTERGARDGKRLDGGGE